MKNKIFIINQYDLKNHHIGLEYLARKNGINIIYLSSNHIRKILKSILQLNFSLFFDQVCSIYYYFFLLVSANAKLIIAIEPDSPRLLFLKLILKNHKTFYHTSFPIWNKRQSKIPLVLNSWDKFLRSEVSHIFAVSNYVKNEILENRDIEPKKISLVYHAVHPAFNFDNKEKKSLKFLFSGRLEKSKGVSELIDLFSNQLTKYEISFVGRGKLAKEVKKVSKKYPNIFYLGYHSKPSSLSKIYNMHNFLLQPSKKEGVWQELFGISIIEAMTCGLIPIASSHIGPKEIIDNGFNGVLFEENNFDDNLIKFLRSLNQDKLELMQKNVLSTASKFSCKNISNLWEKVLA